MMSTEVAKAFVKSEISLEISLTPDTLSATLPNKQNMATKKNKQEKKTTLIIQTELLVPAGATPVLAADGAIAGFKLPSGSIIRPQVSLEEESPNGRFRELNTDSQRKRLGFEILEYSGISFSSPEPAK
jgi:hypothetical protein